MANVKITELASGIALTGPEVFETVQSATSVKVTADQIKDFTSDEPDLVSPRISGTVPASASATGVAGTVVTDSDYIYVCTATDTWKRVAIATWP